MQPGYFEPQYAELAQAMDRIRSDYPELLASDALQQIENKFHDPQEALPDWSTTRIKQIYNHLRTRDHDKMLGHMPEDPGNHGLYLLWLQMWSTSRYQPENPEEFPELLRGKKDLLIPKSWLDENNLLADLQKVRSIVPDAESDQMVPYRSMLSHHPSIKVIEELLTFHYLGPKEIHDLLATTFSVHGRETYLRIKARVTDSRINDKKFMDEFTLADETLSTEFMILNQHLEFPSRTIDAKGRDLRIDPEAYRSNPNFKDLDNLVLSYMNNFDFMRNAFRTFFDLKQYNFFSPEISVTERKNRGLRAGIMVSTLFLVFSDPLDLSKTMGDVPGIDSIEPLFRYGTPLLVQFLFFLKRFGENNFTDDKKQRHMSYGNWDFKMPIASIKP